MALTPDVIKAMAESGKLSPEDLALFSPEERKIYDSFGPSKGEQVQGAVNKFFHPDQGGIRLPDWAGPAAQGVGLAVTGGMGVGAAGLKSAASAVKPLAVGGAGLYAIEKARENGILTPHLANAIEMALGFKMMMGGGGGAAAAEGPLSVEQELVKKGINPANARAAVAGEGMNAPRTVGRLSPSLAGEGDIAEQVQRGVTNDFTPGKRVTFQKPVQQRSYDDINLMDAYPPNVKTESNVSDLMEMLTGSSHGRGESPTPMQFDDKDLRNTLDRLKNATARRRP